MTRKDWEKIEQVLKDCKRTVELTHGAIPDYPSAEWMRRRIVLEIAERFELQGEAEEKFFKQAGVTRELERTFK